MDSDSIVAFDTSFRKPPRIEALASPVLQLSYAVFFIGKTDNVDVNWLQDFKKDHPELLENLKAFSDDDAHPLGLSIQALAAELGYVSDETVERFLEDFPELPPKGLELLPKNITEKDDKYQSYIKKIETRLKSLSKKKTANALQKHLRVLWSVLEPLWKSEGEKVVTQECNRITAAIDKTDDALSLLPPHHFSQFEAYRDYVVETQKDHNVVITPLYFASIGGYVLSFGKTLYLGYGLQSELEYDKLTQKIKDVSMQMKAFADPTRLMILALIAKFHVTVGDLAKQLDVSQPTVSGHLKLLRDTGLVNLEKKGNKSYYTINQKELDTLYEGVKDIVLPE